jgi:hypothetical protein
MRIGTPGLAPPVRAVVDGALSVQRTRRVPVMPGDGTAALCARYGVAVYDFMLCNFLPMRALTDERSPAVAEAVRAVLAGEVPLAAADPTVHRLVHDVLHDSDMALSGLPAPQAVWLPAPRVRGATGAMHAHGQGLMRGSAAARLGPLLDALDVQPRHRQATNASLFGHTGPLASGVVVTGLSRVTAPLGRPGHVDWAYARRFTELSAKEERARAELRLEAEQTMRLVLQQGAMHLEHATYRASGGPRRGDIALPLARALRNPMAILESKSPALAERRRYNLTV